MRNVLLFLLMMVMLSCNRIGSEKVYEHWNKGNVDSFGAYINNKEQLRLSVYNDNGLLRYMLIQHTDTVLRSSENASIYQKWHLYLDDDNNFWVDSSDIGTWVWIKEDNNRYQKFMIEQRPKGLRIPALFIDKMSDSHKTSFLNHSTQIYH